MKKEVLYINNIFHNTFITNHRWQIIIGSNLKLPMKLLFYPPINNNLLFMIYCENVKTSYYRHNIFKTIELQIL